MKYTYIIISIILLLGAWYIFRPSPNAVINEKHMNDLSTYSVATFAGGCFWCIEAVFTGTDGVVSAVSGYTGGEVTNPTYEQVASGTTGHREAVQVYYDPEQVTYNELLTAFWTHIDPVDDGGQFADRGPQYTTAIYYHTPEQQLVAENSKDALATSGKFNEPIATEILPVKTFYRAEEYHQDYAQKQSTQYALYNVGSGRAGYVASTWKDGLPTQPSSADLRDTLTPLQYKVTQQEGTEPAFNNEYWDHHEPGIYVDIISGEPLFASTDKFDSGTGWPSFTKPISEEALATSTDYKLSTPRTEVRSAEADSHLGHVFKDGPQEAGGLRYCINSAALRFIPASELEDTQYAQYADLFK